MKFPMIFYNVQRNNTMKSFTIQIQEYRKKKHKIWKITIVC